MSNFDLDALNTFDYRTAKLQPAYGIKLPFIHLLFRGKVVYKQTKWPNTICPLPSIFDLRVIKISETKSSWLRKVMSLPAVKGVGPHSSQVTGS